MLVIIDHFIPAFLSVFCSVARHCCACGSDSVPLVSTCRLLFLAYPSSIASAICWSVMVHLDLSVCINAVGSANWLAIWNMSHNVAGSLSCWINFCHISAGDSHWNSGTVCVSCRNALSLNLPVAS